MLEVLDFFLNDVKYLRLFIDADLVELEEAHGGRGGGWTKSHKLSFLVILEYNRIYKNREVNLWIIQNIMKQCFWGQIFHTFINIWAERHSQTYHARVYRKKQTLGAPPVTSMKQTFMFVAGSRMERYGSIHTFFFISNLGRRCGLKLITKTAGCESSSCLWVA